MKSNKKSKIISISLVVVIVVVSILVFLIPPLLTAKYDDELIVYNWADYIETGVISDFEAYYKEVTGRSIKVTYTNFDTNETMLTEIIKGDSKIDIICPSEYAIEKLLRNGVLEKLDFSEVAEYDHLYINDNVNPNIREKIGAAFSGLPLPDGTTADMNDYFLPYMWGTLGILYNTNYLTEEQVAEAGWGLLWNTTGIPDIEGKILVKDSIRDTYAAACMYLKEYELLPEQYQNMSTEELINNTDKELVDLVEEVLKDQKKHLKGYEVDFGKDDMVNEIALVDLAWSGDAMYAIEESAARAADEEPYLDYFVPEIGGNIWFDGWVMPKNAENKFAALMFLNFLSRPDIAMRNMMEIGYTSAEDVSAFFVDDENDPNYEYAAEALEIMLDIYEIDTDDEDEVNEFLEEFFGDIRRYPDIDNDDSLGMMNDFGNRNEDIVEMWERVKSHGETGNWAILGIIIGIIVGVAAIAAALIAWKFYRKPKDRKVSVVG